MKYCTTEQAEKLNGETSRATCPCGETYKIELLDEYANPIEMIVCDSCYENEDFINQF